MPRKNLIRTDMHPYHVNARSNNKDWFIPDLKICFDIFLNVIEKTKKKYSFEFHHFILMNNHFHMIITTKNSNIAEGMRYFMTETSRKIARSSNRINKIYGQRYHWTLIENSVQYAHAVKYLYQNAVEAGITKACQGYPYNSLNVTKYFTENTQGFDQYLPSLKYEFLEWINDAYPPEVQDSIHRALQKPIFRITKSRINNQKVDLQKYLKNSK